MTGKNKKLPNILDKPTLVPFFVAEKKPVDFMSVGATHVICISQSKAYVFGDNSFGQCGVGANENVRTPTMLLKGKYIMSAAASKKTSFFVSWTGSVYACGTSDFGNLGLNSSTESY